MRAPADTVTGKWNRPLRAVVDVGTIVATDQSIPDGERTSA